jgi:hypothetical protein
LAIDWSSCAFFDEYGASLSTTNVAVSSNGVADDKCNGQIRNGSRCMTHEPRHAMKVRLRMMNPLRQMSIAAGGVMINEG